LYFGVLGESWGTVTRKKHGKPIHPLDKDFRLKHTETMLQLSGNSSQTGAPHASLVDLRKGDAAILDRIDLPTEDARRLMELGFVPGTRITAGLSAPGGDPRVFQVDGSEIALRRETARRLRVRAESSVKSPKPLPKPRNP
jgi:ferrous iron transport protein A